MTATAGNVSMSKPRVWLRVCYGRVYRKHRMRGYGSPRFGYVDDGMQSKEDVRAQRKRARRIGRDEIQDQIEAAS